MFETLYYGNTILEWLLALSIIAVSFAIGRIVYWLFGRLIKWVGRRDTMIDDYITQMQEPLVFIMVIAGFRYSLSTLTLPAMLTTWPDHAYNLLFALGIAWLVIRLFEVCYDHYLIPILKDMRADFDRQVSPALRGGVKFVVWSLGIAIGLHNAGYDVGAMFAGLGIGGIAFAIAAQDTVANAFGGLTVFLNQPFKIGDRIEVEGIDGWVIDLGLRYTRIADFFGQQVTVPNKVFTAKSVKNIDTRPAYYERTILHLRHDTPPEHIDLALRLLRDIATQSTLINDAVWARFDTIGDYSLDLQLWYGVTLWTATEQNTFADYYHKVDAAKTHLNLEILREFAKHDIKLTFPVGAIELRMPTAPAAENHRPSLFR